MTSSLSGTTASCTTCLVQRSTKSAKKWRRQQNDKYKSSELPMAYLPLSTSPSRASVNGPLPRLTRGVYTLKDHKKRASGKRFLSPKSKRIAKR